MARRRNLLDHAPVIQNQGLRGTSAWANLWLGRDHVAKREKAANDKTAMHNQERWRNQPFRKFPIEMTTKKLHIIGELMNNSYARARNAFTAAILAGYGNSPHPDRSGAEYLTLNIDGTQRIQVGCQEMLDFLPDVIPAIQEATCTPISLRQSVGGIPQGGVETLRPGKKRRADFELAGRVARRGSTKWSSW